MCKAPSPTPTTSRNDAALIQLCRRRAAVLALERTALADHALGQLALLERGHLAPVARRRVRAVHVAEAGRLLEGRVHVRVDAEAAAQAGIGWQVEGWGGGGAG